MAAIDDGFFSTLCQVKGIDPATALAHYDHGGPERMCDLTVRTGPWGDRYGEVPGGLTLDAIKAQPHGIDLGPMVPRIDEILAHRVRQGRAGAALPHGDLPRLAARVGPSAARAASCSSAAATSARRTRGCTTSTCS